MFDKADSTLGKNLMDFVKSVDKESEEAPRGSRSG
jgi:hypothetical protein